MHLSVIIPTRNRAELLEAALASLAGQSLSRDGFEVLVVDNGSTDRTPAVAERARASGLPVRLVPAPAPGLHSGRHAGLREARGEILVYADDDIEAFPTWLASVAAACADPEVVLVGGNNLPRFTVPPPGWLLRLWDAPGADGSRMLPALSLLELPAGPARDFNPACVWGCNFSIRKQTLLAAGGFHPDGMPEQLLHLRGDGESHVTRYVGERGLRCRFHPGASVYHKVTPERMTLAYFRARGFRQGISASYTALRAGQPPGAPWPRLRFAWQGVRARLTAYLAADPEAQQAQLEFVTGLRAGYAHHQHMYRTRTELREWVHKPTYL